MKKYLSFYKKHSAIKTTLFLVTLVVLLYFSQKIIWRSDWTQDKRFSLSAPTIALLKDLSQPIYFTIFLHGDLPASLKPLQNEIKYLLQEFSFYAPSGYFFYDFQDPFANENKQKLSISLQQKGLEPAYINSEKDGLSIQQTVFPGALLHNKDKEIALNFFNSSTTGFSQESQIEKALEQLEYKLAQAIEQLTLGKKKQIAFLEGHGELAEKFLISIKKVLDENYLLTHLNIAEQKKVLPDLLIIAKPTNAFSEADKFYLDQYVMAGGKILWLLDKTNQNTSHLLGNETVLLLPNDLNLDDLLFQYGVRINADVLQDLQASPIPVAVGSLGGQAQFKLFPWFFSPLIAPNKNFDHLISQKIPPVKLDVASSINFVGKKSQTNLKKHVLLTSSVRSKISNLPFQVNLNSLRQEPDIRSFNIAHIPVAVLLEGEFNSAFLGRILGDKNNFLSKSPFTKMLVVSDGDIIANEFQNNTGQSFPLGFDRYTQQTYGNQDFLLNAISYLLDEEKWINLRHKNFILRTLDQKKVQREKLFWQLINILFPLFFIFSFFMLFYFWRKINLQKK